MKTRTSEPDTAAMPDDSAEYLTKQQFAKRLGISTRTVDALMHARKIPYLKLTRKLVRFPKADVDEYLAKNFRVNAVGE